ncbi:unnamed protein product [Rotaria magnacalcarata]
MLQSIINVQNQMELNITMYQGAEVIISKEDKQDEYQYPYRQARKRRNEHGEGEGLTQSTGTPKRRIMEKINNIDHAPLEIQEETGTSSYFNNHRTFRKQANESSSKKQQQQQQQQQYRESFPPCRIKLKEDNYPVQDVTIIKELNKKCKLNLYQKLLNKDMNGTQTFPMLELSIFNKSDYQSSIRSTTDLTRYLNDYSLASNEIFKKQFLELLMNPYERQCYIELFNNEEVLTFTRELTQQVTFIDIESRFAGP